MPFRHVAQLRHPFPHKCLVWVVAGRLLEGVKNGISDDHTLCPGITTSTSSTWTLPTCGSPAFQAQRVLVSEINSYIGHRSPLAIVGTNIMVNQQAFEPIGAHSPVDVEEVH